MASRQQPATITVYFVNNDGGGFADDITVKKGTPIGELFEARMEGRDPKNFMISIDREPDQARSVILEDDMTISITPTKVAAA